MNDKGEMDVDDEVAKIMACTLQCSMVLRPATRVKQEAADAAESALARRVVVPSRAIDGVMQEAATGVKQESSDAAEGAMTRGAVATSLAAVGVDGERPRGGLPGINHHKW